MKNYTEIADTYASDVLSNKIPACVHIKNACNRYQRDRKNKDWKYESDVEKANRVCSFIEKLPLTKSTWALENKRFILEPWQVWITVNIFAFVNKITRLRRFRIAMILVPRKNGKSELAAAYGVYLLAADEPKEFGAEVYCGAGSEKQAWTVFMPAMQMVKRTPMLAKHFGIQANASNLHIATTNSKFEPIIGKPGDGSSPSLAILDECHESDTPDLRNSMLTGMGARTQPLLLMISTAGVNLSSPCFDDALTGRSIVNQSVVDEQRFYAEWTIDDKDDWTDPAVLKKANPNYGVSVFHDFLESRQNDAIRNTREQSPFRTKHLNSWVSAKFSFFNLASWGRCYKPELTLESMEGRSCYIGMDLASKSDIAAMVLVFPPEMDESHFSVFYNFYLPEDVVNDPGKDYYKAWVLDQKLITTEGNIIDFDRIMMDLEKHRTKFNVEEIAFDPSQATYFMTMLMAKGIKVIDFKQWAQNFSEPMKYCAALMDGGNLHHNCTENDPMTWMISNVVSTVNNKDQVYPNKEKPEKKIDGAIGLIMAMARAIMGGSHKSVYEERGIISFG